MPALPQHMSGSAMSITSNPGICASSARGCARTRCACDEVTGVVVGDGGRDGMARRSGLAELDEQLGHVAHATR